MTERWLYVGDQLVLEFFGRCQLRDRQRLLNAMTRLAANPYVKPESIRSDQAGRQIATTLLNGFRISYWLDHFVKEVRIVDVSRA